MVPGMYARLASLALAASVCLGAGCTSFEQYVHNGFKVGPNVCDVEATVAERWIDETDVLRPESGDLDHWWSVFQDPVLERLVTTAQEQNLTLREAGFRILQARSQLGIVTGNLFPQVQHANGGSRRIGAPTGAPTPMEIEYGSYTVPFTLTSRPHFFDQYNLGFNLAWELDFWGRFRRAIVAAEHSLDASMAEYSSVQVTLLGDVAVNYVQIRTLQKRLECIQANIALQQQITDDVELKKDRGLYRPLDFYQSAGVLAETKARAPQLQLELREAQNRLCVLLGMPPADLQEYLGPGKIPEAPPQVVVGIPADLLRRRPDVQRAGAQAAAQAEQIGIAVAQFYPALTINGTLGYQSPEFSRLLSSDAFAGSFGPSFQWNLLNYGRIINNVRLQEARFSEAVTNYQSIVLRANAEVENGLARFLRARERAQQLGVSVENAELAVREIEAFRAKGRADPNQVSVITQAKVQQDDFHAQAEGEIALGLIQVYRALGGGWDSWLPAEPAPSAVPGAGPEQLPAPATP